MLAIHAYANNLLNLKIFYYLLYICCIFQILYFAGRMWPAGRHLAITVIDNNQVLEVFQKIVSWFWVIKIIRDILEGSYPWVLRARKGPGFKINMSRINSQALA